jgi:hypothetical protein
MQGVEDARGSSAWPAPSAAARILRALPGRSVELERPASSL